MARSSSVPDIARERWNRPSHSPGRWRASLAFAGTDPCSWVFPGTPRDRRPLAPTGTAAAAPARTKQGQQFDGTPQQGAAESECRMSDEATRHGVFSFESTGGTRLFRHTAAIAGSEIIQLPDHHPGLVEHAIDVTEEAVDEGLHGELLMSVVGDTDTIAEHCCSRFSQA